MCVPYVICQPCPMINACHCLVLKGLNYDINIVICWNCLKFLSATQSLICLIVYHLIVTLIIIILEAIVLSSMLLNVIKMFLNHF